MRIEYESTLQDVVEASVYAHGRIQHARRIRRITAVALFASVALVFTLIVDAPLVVRANVGVFMAVVSVTFWWIYEKGRVRRYLKRALAEMRGTSGPIPVELTISEHAVAMSWQGLTIEVQWSSIRTIELNDRAMTLVGPSSTSLMIPAHAFASSEQQAEFTREVRHYLRACGNELHLQCPNCQQDLHGIDSDECPECGAIIQFGPVAK